METTRSRTRSWFPLARAESMQSFMAGTVTGILPMALGFGVGMNEWKRKWKLLKGLYRNYCPTSVVTFFAEYPRRDPENSGPFLKSGIDFRLSQASPCEPTLFLAHQGTPESFCAQHGLCQSRFEATDAPGCRVLVHLVIPRQPGMQARH